MNFDKPPSPATHTRDGAADASAGLRLPATGAVLVALLKRGRTIDRFSLAAFALGAASLAWPLEAGAYDDLAGACFLLSLAAGIAQKVFAWRVGLDGDLFAALYRYGPVDDKALGALDAGLANTVGATPSHPPRPLENRWAGAMKLVRRQAISSALQAALLLVALGLRYYG